jgi:hypothetical protein
MRGVTKAAGLALLLLLSSCKGHDEVTSPQVFPSILGRYTAWTICGRTSVTPPLDYTNPSLRVEVTQSGSHFTIRVPQVGVITGELAPYTPNRMSYTWTLTFEAPCSGVVSGADTTDGFDMRFDFVKTDDWQCAGCTGAAAGGSIRVFTPAQPI